MRTGMGFQMGHESARPGLGPRQRQGPQRPARAARRAAAAAVTVTSHRHPAAVTPVIYYARSVPDTQAGIMSHHVTACQWASGPARAGGSRGSHHRVTLAVPVTGGIMSHAHPAAVTVSAGLGVTVTQSVAALCLPGCLGQWSESDIMCRRRRTGTDSESHKFTASETQRPSHWQARGGPPAHWHARARLAAL